MVMAKVKVLYLCPVGYIGGAERFVLNLLEEKQNCQVFCSQVLLLNRGPLENELARLGVKFDYLPNKLRLLNVWQLARSIYFIRNFLRTQKIDIVHSTMPYAHLLVSLSTLGNSKIKKIWFQHGPVGGWLDRLASVFSVDKILFNSKFLREEHNKTKWQRQQLCKQSVFPLALAFKFFLKEEERRESGFFQILAMGRIYYWKGFDIIIRALGEIPKDLLAEHKVKLIIQGEPQGEEGSNFLTQLHLLVKELDLSSHIEFRDFNLDVEKLLSQTQLLIHTPRGAEPFGYVVAEAMAARCLVIGVSKGGVAELLDQGRGFMIDSTLLNAHKDLAKLLLDILTGKFNFKDKIDRAQGYVLEKHHSKKVVEELEQVYSSLLLQGKRR
jgi:glycosyltransferase involved in cell wall biosynthesis